MEALHSRRQIFWQSPNLYYNYPFQRFWNYRENNNIMLFKILIIVQILSAITIIGLVLLQHGKGADMGAAFGAGASGSLFGATGSSNFLSRSTAVAAVVFFVATLVLAYMGNLARPAADKSVVEKLETMRVAPAVQQKIEKVDKEAGLAAVPGAPVPPEKPADSKAGKK